MKTALANPVEKWLQEACKKWEFPQTQLAYTPLNSQPAEQKRWRIDTASSLSAPHWPDSATLAWQTPVFSQQKKIGHLQLHTAQAGLLQPDFFQACYLAEQIAKIAAEYADSLRPTQAEISIPATLIPTAPLRPETLRQLVADNLKSFLQTTNYQGLALFLLNEKGTVLNLKHYFHRSLGPLSCSQRNLNTADLDRQALSQGIGFASRLPVRKTEISGRPQTNRQPEQPDCETDHDAWLPAHSQAGVCVRVACHGRQLGTLWAFHDASLLEDPAEKRKQLQQLQSLANQLGSLLSQAIEDWNSLQHRRYRRELKQAAVIQPASLIAYCDSQGRFEASGKCLSRFEVGGDFCEVIPLDADRILIVIGDACGNSFPAAIVMTAVRAAVYTLVAELWKPATHQLFQSQQTASTPADLVTKLNRVLLQLTDSQLFMSCVCGIFDLKSQQLSFCNAGHPHPLQLNAQSGRLDKLSSHGLPLGIQESTGYQDSQISLTSGDVLIFYSDGISEAVNSNQVQFLTTGIELAARKKNFSSAKAIEDSIWSHWQTHQQGGSETDDSTILVAKLN